MNLRTDFPNIAPSGHLEATGHRIVDTPLIYPGVRGKLKRAIRINENTLLKAGTRVIIQPLNRDNPNDLPRFKVTPYRDNKKTQRKDQPESHRDIITDDSHVIAFEKPEDFLSFNNEYYQRRDSALFPAAESPSLEEISQLRIPDCFLLAAIQAVINHPNGKAYIRGMMHQNNDGTTTVRLFDPVTLRPEYIRVENSVIVDRFGELNAHSALWVHILEKAYAALGKRYQNGIETVDASVSSVYSEGGVTTLALSTLTGLKTSWFDTKPKAYPWDVKAFFSEGQFNTLQYLITHYSFDDHTLASKIGDILTPQKLAAIYDLMGANAQDDAAKQQALNHYLQLFKCYLANPEEYNNAWKHQSTKKLAKTHPGVAVIVKSILTRLQPFSGHNTLHDLAVYQKIQHGLRTGSCVTAGTHTELDHNPKGIITNHAFSILGTFEKEMRVKDDNGQEKTITARFIQLRNPWGDKDGFITHARNFFGRSISRAYEQHEDHLDIRTVGSNDATFHLELSEFCRYFLHYDISASANHAFQRDALKEKCIADVTTFCDEFNIDFTSSNQDLIEASSEYDKHLKNLITFELHAIKNIDADTMAFIHRIFKDGYSSEEEQRAIQALLDETKFPTISGTSDEVINHVYCLLKLNWLMSQPEQDKQLTGELVKTIQKHAALPELWEKLSQVSMILNVIIGMRAKQFSSSLDYMETLAKKLRDDMRKFSELMNPQVQTQAELMNLTAEQLISNFEALERLYAQYLNLDVVTRHLTNTSINEQSLVDIAAVIEECKQVIEPILETKPLFQQLWALRDDIRMEATDMAKKHKISPEEYQTIKTATKYIFSGKMKPIGDKLLASASEERQALGTKLIEADTLAKKISRAFKRLGSFFSRTASRMGTFFHVRNQYEIPALETPKAVRCRG